jgi:hypothetical protein
MVIIGVKDSLQVGLDPSSQALIEERNGSKGYGVRVIQAHTSSIASYDIH